MIRHNRTLVLAMSVLFCAPLVYGQGGWKSEDIGGSTPGSTNIVGGTFTIAGNGSDIWGGADSFRFVYLLGDGNCEIMARVVSQQNTHEWAKAGVMIRQSLTATSPHGHINRNWGATHGIEFQYRPTEGAATTTSDNGAAAPLPRWLRLRRVGNTFSGYYAPDVGGSPGNWSQQGPNATVNMTDPVHVGLSVLSHVTGTLSTVVFDNVVTTGTRKVGAGLIVARGRSPVPPAPSSCVLSRLYASLFPAGEWLPPSSAQRPVFLYGRRAR